MNNRHPYALQRKATRRRFLASSLALSAVWLAPTRMVHGQDQTSGTPAPSSEPVSPLPVSENAQAMAERIFSAEMTNDAANALLEALATCGIATYGSLADTSPLIPVAEPLSPVRFLYSQLQSMAAEIRAGGGSRGAEIDALFELSPDQPPPSWILAGYLGAVETPAADIARATLFSSVNLREPGSVTFPALIGALLAHDLATEQPATAKASALDLTRVAPYTPLTHSYAAASVCSTLQSWVDTVTQEILDALKISNPPDGFLGILSSIWNFIVDVGVGIISAALKVLTEPVMSLIRSIAGVLATGSQILSMMQPWYIAVSVDPPSFELPAEGSAPVEGAAQAKVTTELDATWPAEIADCAAMAGVTLPNLTAEDGTAEWEIVQSPQPLVIAGESTEIDADGQTMLDFTSMTEPADWKKGPTHEGTVLFQTTVERPGIQELREQMMNLAFSALPGIVRAAVEPILGPIAATIVDGLLDLATVRGSAVLTVVYHSAPEPEPEAETGTTEGEDVPCMSGTYELVDFASTLNAMMASQGSGAVFDSHTGSWTLTFIDDTNLRMDWSAFSVTGGEATQVGTVSVTVNIDGNLVSDYTYDGNTLTLQNADGLNLAISASASLDGMYIGEFPIGAGELGLASSASYIVSCGDSLLLTPTWVPGATPMEWRRVPAS